MRFGKIFRLSELLNMHILSHSTRLPLSLSPLSLVDFLRHFLILIHQDTTKTQLRGPNHCQQQIAVNASPGSACRRVPRRKIKEKKAKHTFWSSGIF